VLYHQYYIYDRRPVERTDKLNFGSTYTDIRSIKNRKILPAAHVAVMDDERAETYVIQRLAVKASTAKRLFYATKFNIYE